MSKIISIQNSGESFEKSIALFSTSMKSNSAFYLENEYSIFYGHNLPKKDCKINPHGTLGFYEEFFSKYDWCPIRCEQDLLMCKEDFLKKLCNEGCISNRNATKLMENNINYISFIRRIPMELLFPELTTKVKDKAKKIFPNACFNKVHLEDNFMIYYASLPIEKWAYSIYALNIDGTISHYYFNSTNFDEYDNRNLFHMFGELLKKPVLSGNSALFLAVIQDVTKNVKGLVGYRNHSREIRATRNFALNQFVNEREGIIEPKNVAFSKYFDDTIKNKGMTNESIANMAIAKAYEDFLNEYKIF